MAATTLGRNQSAAVTVYTKPACVQCDMTKKWLSFHGLEYAAVDITEDADALRYVTQTLDYKAAPVVVVSGKYEAHWSGFQPGRLTEHLL